MKFRKLYWASESLPNDGGCSELLGVYTSIPDLIHHGLRPHPGHGLKLTLVKLDSSKAPLGTWTDEDAERLPEALAPYVASEEFLAEAILDLSRALGELRTPAGAPS